MSDRLALIIANSEFVDPKLAKLVTPSRDAEKLAEVLSDPAIGGFKVTTLIEETLQLVRRQIAGMYRAKKRGDLLLLYYSGHGIKDDFGDLYLAVKDTETDIAGATAIEAAYVERQLDKSNSQRKVVVLDCCHSGAFSREAKATVGSSAGTLETFEGSGYGRVIITASNAFQYAWEGSKLLGDADTSVFTHFLVKGLKTGAADLDRDGEIDLDELYQYTYKRVVKATPKQVPQELSRVEGEIVIAKNPHPDMTKPAELPTELQQSIDDSRPWVREGAVQELDRLLRSDHPGKAQAAQQALRHLMEDDSRQVSSAAARSLAAYARAQRGREEAEAGADRLAAEKAEAERIVAEKAEAERIAAEKAEAKRLAAEKAEAKRIAAERAKPERLKVEKAATGVSAAAEAAVPIPFAEQLRRVPAWGWALSGLVALGIIALFIGLVTPTVEKARLEIRSLCEHPSYQDTCATGLQITNLGPANANDLRMAIILESLEDPWSGYLQGMGDFLVVNLTPSFDVVVREARFQESETSVFSLSNGFELLLDTLPSGATVSFMLALDPDLPVLGYDLIQPVILDIENLGFSEASIEDELSEYLRQRSAYASFTVDATCDNCEGPSLRTDVQVSTFSEGDYEIVHQIVAKEERQWLFLMRTKEQFPPDQDYISQLSPLHLRARSEGATPDVFVDEVLGSIPEWPAPIVDLGSGQQLITTTAITSERVNGVEFSTSTEVPLMIGIQNRNSDQFNLEVSGFVDVQLAGDAARIRDSLSDALFDIQEAWLGVHPEILNSKSGVLSVLLGISSYAGGAHPSHRHFALNFDLKNGTRLSLQDLFVPDSEYLERIASYCIQELAKREGVVFSDFEDYASPVPDYYQVWNITPNGLRILFEEYQVASYAAGPQTVDVPFSVLKEIIRPEGPIDYSLDG